MIPDVFGQALKDYYKNKATALFIETSYGEIEEMPLDVFYRKPAEFPPIEHIALKLCKGKILDIGAGAGTHSVYLQSKNKDVTALEISSAAVEIMKNQGVENVIQADIFTYTNSHFDTLLHLMNGIGIAGTLEGLNELLIVFKSILKPGGTVIFDSSDISYLYEEHPLPLNKYFGEISYRYLYKKQKGPWFKWLYIDQLKMTEIANAHGFKFELLCEDETDQYLAKLLI
ncbi:MAG: class I SAM-dependent methyltransferase [Bacteroidetes bacterium]|nr:class I SAM-dependent methyltransferase [Bacteroidota bacterium]